MRGKHPQLPMTGSLHELSSDIVIDKSKLRRERKTRDTLMKNQAPLNLPALYFDGRKDKTLKIVKKGTKRYKQVVIEEHVSVIKEPESIYVGTVDLLAIGCDGTVTNTGKFNGVIRLFERRLQRPLQWIICMLHLNELPLRHLFDYLDGKTSGPSTYNGPIDGEKHIRELAARRILKARSSPTTGKLPRTFEVPELNFDAKSYIDLINWQETNFDLLF
ncbi:hypothetical protein EVAR_70524_1 [Eumeta japonica]|uniref:Uncharacterized protein n=1 Tax=Eumeta variegata TaxID=151549 RepID=A0A4C2A494_EUMVA|nr:hypothetical protein EVAR_70524_1 [Eumeta japonica]